MEQSPLDRFLALWRSPSPTLTVHSSGSTGQPRPMEVEKWRMAQMARRQNEALGLCAGDTALLCMPLEYIAGMMVVVRAEVGALSLLSVPPSSHPLSSLDHSPRFAAMVPMQVSRSLEVERERLLLMGIGCLIIGGGAIDPALAGELGAMPHAVWSTYGMTETLSHIALRRLNGAERSEWYTPLPGVTPTLTSEGCLCIADGLLAESPMVTHDLAELSADGRFRILGRTDNVVCSGGVKIQIERVETLLAPHIYQPYMLTSVPDALLGSALTMLYVPVERGMGAPELADVCHRVLPRHHAPRHYVAVDRLPLTATGKPARAEAAKLARERMG